MAAVGALDVGVSARSLHIVNARTVGKTAQSRKGAACGRRKSEGHLKPSEGHYGRHWGVIVGKTIKVVDQAWSAVELGIVGRLQDFDHAWSAGGTVAGVGSWPAKAALWPRHSIAGI